MPRLGPLLNSYATIRSEIFNDSGVPHTLEHLIFLGSEKYPYKGVLDTLANRAFAQGTNAWTAQDHTAYTLTTAGSDGFLRMLPVYLDHVFHPTLTKEGFVTEVYHVNGKGEDAGVVFSEMQGRENSSGDLMQLEYQRKLYEASSGYRSETGGLMSALRVLTIDDIRQYHHKYYMPYNTAIVVCGPLDRTELLDSLQPTEDGLVQHGVRGAPQGWKRPFLETASAKTPVLPQSRVQLTVDFPEKDESVGEVMVSWVGPRVDEWEIQEAISVLGTYLTDSAVSPAQKALVERDDPQCTEVYFSTSDKAGASTIEVYLTNVPATLLDKLDGTLVDEVLSQVCKDGIDMGRMQTIIARERTKLLNQLETKPADSFADVFITDFLYGDENGRDLQASIDSMRRFDALEKYDSATWTAILQKWLIDNPRIVVSGRPSADLAEKIKSETQALIEKRKNDLGEQGLAKLDKALQEAQKANDVEVPKEMLSQFKIPDVKSINWIPVGTVSEGHIASSPLSSDTSTSNALDEQLKQHLNKDQDWSPPLFVQWNQIPSNFVTISVMLNTTPLAANLRPLLNLFLSSIFSLPIQEADGTVLSYEEVVKQLDEDTLEYDANLGAGPGFAELITIEIKVEKAKYQKGLQWIYDLLWNTQFSQDRIKVNAAKIAQSLPEQKRDGRTISWSLSRSITHSDQLSSNLLNNVLTQSEIIPKIVEQLASSSTASQVIDQIEEVRRTLLKPELMLVSVAGDILSIPQPKKALKSITEQIGWESKVIETQRIPMSRFVMTPLGKQPAKKGVITPLPTLESSFAVFTAKGITGFQDEDYAALSVTVSALNAMESYLWRYIRGAGLAYGASIRSDAEGQLIHFSLYRSPDSAKAFSAASEVIEQLVSGKMEIGEDVLESAKSSLCFGVADSEGTVSSAAGEAFSDSVLRGTGRGRGRRLIEDAKNVTIDQVRSCLAKYIQPIFDPSKSICAIACSPGRLEEMKSALEKVGYEMERRDLNFAEDAEDEEGSDGDASKSSDASKEDNSKL